MRLKVRILFINKIDNMCTPYKYKQVVSFSHLTLLLQAESDDCVLSLSVFSEAKAKASPPPVLTYNQKSSEKCHVTKGMYFISGTIYQH